MYVDLYMVFSPKVRSNPQSYTWLPLPPGTSQGTCWSHRFQCECNSRCCCWQASPAVAVHRSLPDSSATIQINTYTYHMYVDKCIIYDMYVTYIYII